MHHYSNWKEEKRSAYLYHVLQQHETSILRKKLFRELTLAAEKQALIWEARIRSENNPPPPAYEPDLRTRLMIRLIRLLGIQRLRYLLSAMKIRGMSTLGNQHYEERHTAFSSANNLRAAVFGINDGLVSNMSLILGMVGANVNTHTVLIAGIAGLLAGATSMGAGEYVSVRSQREIFEHQIEIEKQELEEYPDEEKEELSFIYEARGIPKEEASKLASLMIDNPEIGLNTLAREELGLNPDDIVSPIAAMLYSFFSFMFGALLPLTPFILSSHPSNIWISMGITGIALFCIGMVISLFSNRSPIWSGLRILAIGTAAGLLTFVIGNALGYH
jgi:vacuolar iron transporter family protein